MYLHAMIAPRASCEAFEKDEEVGWDDPGFLCEEVVMIIVERIGGTCCQIILLYDKSRFMV